MALDLALDNVGKSIPAKMAMMAMTTRSSIKVKAHSPCKRPVNVPSEFRFAFITSRLLQAGVS